MSHEIQAHEYLKTQGQRSVTVTHGVNGSGSREGCENNTTAYAWSCILTMVRTEWKPVPKGPWPHRKRKGDQPLVPNLLD